MRLTSKSFICIILMLASAKTLAQLVQINGNVSADDPTESNHLATKNYVDGKISDLDIGVVDISQGETFPIIISEPGNYRLISNLDVTNEPIPQNVTAIRIETDNVHLDLNGFSILGPNTPGTGYGIEAFARRNITVINGTVKGMGFTGVIGRGSGETFHVERVRAIENGGHGIGVGPNSTVIKCITINNVAAGISAGRGSLATGNVSHGNSQGILIREGSSVIGNTIRNNSSYGLKSIQASETPTPTVGYALNVFTGNNGGSAQVFGGTETGTNLCRFDTNCP